MANGAIVHESVMAVASIECYISGLRLLLQKAALNGEVGTSIILASSFYTASLERPFVRALGRCGDARTIYCVPYNQLDSFLLNPRSFIPDGVSTTVILLFRVEDLIRLELVEAANNEVLETEPTLRAFAARNSQFLTILGSISNIRLTALICPSGRGAYDISFLGNALNVAEHRSAATLRLQQRHRVIRWPDCEREFSDVPMFNIAGDRLGHVPFTPEGLDALAEYFVRQLDNLPTTTLRAQECSSGDSVLQKFLGNLELKLDISPLLCEDEEKVVSLVRHTTHFINKPDEKGTKEIRSTIVSSAAIESWAIRVRDRFGNYGISGLVTFTIDGETMRIGLWLLSCQVLGKQVEYAVMAWMAQTAEQRNAATIEIPFRKGRDNQILYDFLTQMKLDDQQSSASVQPSSVEKAFLLPVTELRDRSLASARNPEAAAAIYSSTYSLPDLAEVDG